MVNPAQIRVKVVVVHLIGVIVAAITAAEVAQINDIAESLAFEPTKLPGVGTAWEIAKGIYNNWDDITDFLNPFSNSDPPPSETDPLADRFDRLRNPLFGPGF